MDNLFGVSKSGTAQLRAGISNIEVSDAYFQPEDTKANLKPLLSIITEQSLNASEKYNIHIFLFLFFQIFSISVRYAGSQYISFVYFNNIINKIYKM